MNRSQKKEFIDAFSDVLARSSVVLVTHQTGLDVATTRAFRSDLRKEGGKYTVVKASLARLAAHHQAAAVATLFRGPVGVITGDSPSKLAKIVADFAKKTGRLNCLGGLWEGTSLSAKEAERLSFVPTRDELKGRFLWLMKATSSSFVRLLSAYAGTK